MKNIGKKGLILAVATSLSIFAGTEIVKNQNTTTTNTAGHMNMTSERVSGCTGEMSEEHKQMMARMDELKKKLENGTATKEEQKEIAQFLNNRGAKGRRGQYGEGRNNTNNQNRITPERIEELKTKIKSGKLTTTEANEVLQLLERRGPREPRPEMNKNTSNVNNNVTK